MDFILRGICAGKTPSFQLNTCAIHKMHLVQRTSHTNGQNALAQT